MKALDLIQATLAFTEHFFATEFSGHDYYHTLRVFHTATRIARAEQADLELVQLAALLH
ncbi:MAG: HD domain-containing protein, partial [Oscillospiraceae bacterium]|nr:HD domain-containing protein [Oscillospiraceae bacterium]